MSNQTRPTTVWITGDQCSLDNSALAAVSKSNAVVLMVESISRGNMLKYHKKKLVLIYSVMRHFAVELKEAGWQVDYYREAPDFQTAVKAHLDKCDPAYVFMMQQSEYGADQRLGAMLGGRELKIFPHCNFVSTAEEFERLHRSPESRVTMESFYRLMRKKTGVLVDAGQPVGGEWNFDKSNREAPGETLASVPLLEFPPDEITKDVIEMVNRYFAEHPGSCENWIYAVTRKDALRAAHDFFEHRLDEFGPHQDAMIQGQAFLNHSVLSPYINTCLLHPLELCREAERRYLNKEARISSVEGFVRQLIGWREFVWRVYWRKMPEYKTRNELDAREKLPEFFWTGNTDMLCLRDAIQTTIEHGYAHHIVRLMILGNFALIAGLDPQETHDWFHQMYVDGYDWVMAPNVIGMALHADGGYVGTKPYAASANYIGKMSNYCRNCSYDQKKSVEEKACPFNALYWDFLLRNQQQFAKNHRMALVMKGLSSRSDDWKAAIRSRVEDLRKSGWS